MATMLVDANLNTVDFVPKVPRLIRSEKLSGVLSKIKSFEGK